jgi:glycosyltransferase involved in cell wall biosynthesis
MGPRRGPGDSRETPLIRSARPKPGRTLGERPPWDHEDGGRGNAGRSIRLLFVGGDLRSGGAEAGLISILEAVRPPEFNVTLFLLRERGSLLDRLPPHVRLVSLARGDSRLGLRLPLLAERIFRLARRSDAVIASQEASPTYTAIVAARLTGRPGVGNMRTSWSRILQDLPVWHGPVSRALYPWADQILVCSRSAGADLDGFLGDSCPHLVLAPPARDLDALRRAASAGLDEDCLSWCEGPFLAYVGRLEPAKGVDRLIDIFRRVLDGGIEANLILVGEGAQQEALMAQTRRLGLDRKIFFAGWRRNPYPLVRRSRAVVLTSRYEGAPGIAIEAMALGVPVVAYESTPGIRDLLQDGGCGILIEDGQAERFAASLQRLLRDPEWASPIIDRGLLRARDFDSAQAADAFRSFCRSLVTPG